MRETPEIDRLQALARLIRYFCINATSTAHSGHLTSSLSATDLMTALVFGGTFRFKVNEPDHPNNDRLIFSKGHASPLFYALWAAAGAITEQELLTYRRFGSRLEGHPTPRFPYVEAATGSLGQGLGIGLGMALNAKLPRSPPVPDVRIAGRQRDVRRVAVGSDRARRVLRAAESRSASSTSIGWDNAVRRCTVTTLTHTRSACVSVWLEDDHDRRP